MTPGIFAYADLTGDFVMTAPIALDLDVQALLIRN